jgi:DNA-binding beta-propeller fold protein YncE
MTNSSRGSPHRPTAPPRRARRFPALPALAALALLPALGCTSGGEATASGGAPEVSVTVLGGPGDTPGRFSRPRGIACEPDGTLYVVDMSGRLQKLSRRGEPLLSVEMPASAEGKANGLTWLAPRGAEPALLAVADTHYRRITVFRAADLSLVGFRASGEFLFPTALAAVDERWMVTAYGDRSQVAALGAGDGAVIARFGKDGDALGELARPMGVALGPEGDLYVADSCNHRVEVFGPDGTPRRALGRSGTGPGEMRYPYGIAVDARGRVVVAEYGNQRVQVLDGRDGRSLRVFGRAGGAPGEFSSPWGLALDGAGRVYVADRDNNRIQVLEGLLPRE